MRQKIQTKFHEVPKEAHESLRDSLLEHLQNVDEQMSPAILTQLVNIFFQIFFFGLI